MSGSGAPLSWAVVALTAVVCLAGAAFFAGSETGVMSVSRIRLRAQARSRPGARTRRLGRLLADVEDPILTFLIGTNLMNVLLTAVASAACDARWGERGAWAAGAIVAILVISLGEIVPKGIFREHPERAMLAVLPLVRATMLLFAPVRWLLRGYSRLWQRLLPGGTATGATALSREAVTTLLLAHPQPDVADRRFAEALERFLALGRMSLRDIMLPLEQAVALEPGATLADARRAAARSGFSRLPVLDGEGGLSGWILVRDLLLVEPGAEAEGPIPPALLRSCLLADAEMTPYELFAEMHWQRQQMGIVVDGRGRPLGLLTLENLVEAIVGRIEDEFDAPAPAGSPLGGRAA